MSNIYLIPLKVPCPRCGVDIETYKFSLVKDSTIYVCDNCTHIDTITNFLGKYVGMIKDVKDEA